MARATGGVAEGSAAVRTAGFEVGGVPVVQHRIQDARRSCSNQARRPDDRVGRVEPSRCADPHPGAGRPTRRRRPGGTPADGGAGRAQCSSGRSRQPRRQLRRRRQGARAPVPARQRSGRRWRGRSSDMVQAALDSEPWRDGPDGEGAPDRAHRARPDTRRRGEPRRRLRSGDTAARPRLPEGQWHRSDRDRRPRDLDCTCSV